MQYDAVCGQFKTYMTLTLQLERHFANKLHSTTC